MGLCLVFGSDGVPLPKVYDMAHDDADWWNWKDHLQAKRQAYLGRLIRGKATLVSMRLLPAFLSIYYAGGGCASYDEEHYFGRLTQQGKWICDHLDKHGNTPADRLRKELGFKQGEGTKEFHKALLHLQRRFKVVTTGLAGHGWKTRVIGLFEQWVPDAVEKEAQRLSPEDARLRIVSQTLRTAGAIPQRLLPRLFDWEPAAWDAAVQRLITSGVIRPIERPKTREHLWLAWTDLL